MEHYRTFWNILETHGIFQKLMEHPGTLWKVMNITEGYRIFWKVMEIMEIYSIETHGM